MRVQILGDFMLIVNGLNGRWKINISSFRAEAHRIENFVGSNGYQARERSS